MPSMAEVAKEFELDRDLEQKATYEISCATFLLDVRKDGVDSSRCLPAAKSALGVNCNIAATGHKLQGTLKDSLIIGSWNYTFENWIYVVLSTVRTLKGGFVFMRKIGSHEAIPSH